MNNMFGGGISLALVEELKQIRKELTAVKTELAELKKKSIQWCQRFYLYGGKTTTITFPDFGTYLVAMYNSYNVGFAAIVEVGKVSNKSDITVIRPSKNGYFTLNSASGKNMDVVADQASGIVYIYQLSNNEY